MTDDATRSTPTRREAVAMMGAAGALAVAQASPVRARAGQSATGIVFEDRSGTGLREPGDPGIAGVLVSNGCQVAKTDSEGRYALPIGDEGLIFVIKPPGYAPCLDENNLPRFTTLHQPQGTPAALGLRFEGVAPTGPLPASIDFPLIRTQEPSTFDVILFTDPQPQSAAELSYVRDTAIASVLGTEAAFGMTLGDILFDDLSMYPRYNRLIGQVGIPWWHIGGNHDLNYEAPDARRSRETFKRVYGAPYYAFHYGDALFLMLDNVRWLGPGNGYEGRFSDEQLAFVANVLAQTPPEKLVVAAMHIPLATAAEGHRPDHACVNADALLKLLEGRPALSISGHTHTTEHHYLGAASHHHHVLTAVSGSWWSGPFDRAGIACADSCDGSPNGYHVLRVDGARYTTRFVPLSTPADKAMRISLERRGRRPDATIEDRLGPTVAADALGATDLVVNVFDGGPRTLVSCRIGGSEPFVLERSYRPDPFVAQVFSRNAATKKSWVEAIPSTHLWAAHLPADLPVGTHRADIRVTDEYGREHRDSLVVEVTGGRHGAMASRS